MLVFLSNMFFIDLVALDLIIFTTPLVSSKELTRDLELDAVILHSPETGASAEFSSASLL